MNTTFPPTADPGLRDLTQGTFRALLQALARPCSPQALPDFSGPCPLSRELAQAALTLCDHETRVWLSPSLDDEETRRWLRFNTGMQLVPDSRRAHFLLCANAAELPDLDAIDEGTALYPDRSATVLVGGMAFAPDNGSPMRLVGMGPGIRDKETLALCPGETVRNAARLADAEAFCGFWQANHERYPMGFDLFFLGGGRVTGLPRSTTLRPWSGEDMTGFADKGDSQCM